MIDCHAVHAAPQATNPGRIISVPPALVNECISCMEDLATNDTQVFGVGWGGVGWGGVGWGEVG